jgi:LysM repeat protein
VIFAYYFNMLMSSGVQAAIDLLANYPYTTTAASSIQDVANAVGDSTLTSEPLRVVTSTQDVAVLNTGAVLDLPSVVYQVRANDTFVSIAGAFQAQGALDSAGDDYSVTDLFAANVSTAGLFNAGVGVQYSGLGYTTQANDTLNLISARLLLRAAGPGTVNSIADLGGAVQALQQANPSITDPNTAINPATTPTVILASGGTYSVVAGDTLTLIAAYFLAIEQGTIDLSSFLNSLLAIPANKAFVGTDPNQALAAGQAMAMPPVVYNFQSSKTLCGMLRLRPPCSRRKPCCRFRCNTGFRPMTRSAASPPSSI